MSSTERVLRIVGATREIPATFADPGSDERVPHKKRPVALLLHGTASNRDEVAGMYTRLAASLAEVGISSLRIDFPGCGESERPQTEFTVSTETEDALEAITWLRNQDQIDSGRIYLVGFSQGGMIAILAAHRMPDVAGIVSWSSGVIPPGDRRAGFTDLFGDECDSATADMGFASFTFSRTWFEEFTTVDLTVCRDFTMPVLAVCGSEDTTVDPSSALDLISTVMSADRTLIQIPGADHVFNSLVKGDPSSDRVISDTVSWIHRVAFADRSASADAE